MKVILSLAVLVASPCFAQTGADVLLNQLGDKKALPKAQKGGIKTKTVINSHPVGDVFQQQLEQQVVNERKLPFDVRQWTDLVLENEFEKAAHLWTAIETLVPENFSNQAQATQLYLLFRLGLNQTFIDQWIASLANRAYAESNPEEVLETLVTPGLDSMLLQTPLVFSPKQKTILDRLSASSAKTFVLTLKAWTELRDQAKVDPYLSALPATNKLLPYVAGTAVYARVKKDDLKGAAQVLKETVEPIIEATQDLNLLAKHDVSIARILYQAGQMNAAAEFYKKIPNQSPLYLDAREELAWVYLRQGDMAKLRGEIKALASPLFKDRFQPETYLLRAVSDLKMCYYDLLDKDLADFSKSNTVWAKKIDLALASKAPAAPPIPDDYTQISVRRTNYLEAELKRVRTLGEQSVGAALPAVGWQRHWKDYSDRLLATIEEARKRQTEDYLRQWKSDRSTLQEAIRKMRFVKVEYLSQVRQLTAADPAVVPSSPGKMVASNDNAQSTEVLKGEEDQLNFPIKGDVWPDELFKLRSAAQARCLKKVRAQ